MDYRLQCLLLGENFFPGRVDIPGILPLPLYEILLANTVPKCHIKTLSNFIKPYQTLEGNCTLALGGGGGGIPQCQI